MPTPGRHAEDRPGRESGAGARREGASPDAARSTWNAAGGSGARSGGREAERLLGRLDEIQAAVTGAGGQVERLNRLAMLGELSGFLAHEFNNILTPLLASAQLALRQPRDAERMGLALERVVAGIRRATAVSESILGLAKADEPREPGSEAGARAESVSRGTVVLVERCVMEAVGLVREEFEGAGVRVVMEVEKGLEARMEGVDLGEVVLNLLVNAKRAMVAGARRSEKGERVVRVVARASGWTPPRVPRETRQCSYLDRMLPELLREGESGVVRSDNSTLDAGVGVAAGGGGESGGVTGARLCVIEVVDCGGGVDERVLADWARRGVVVIGPASGSEAGNGVRAAGDGRCGGSGLGLDVCLRLVERAGGWIEVESRAGEGTTVRVVVGGKRINAETQ